LFKLDGGRLRPTSGLARLNASLSACFRAMAQSPLLASMHERAALGFALEVVMAERRE